MPALALDALLPPFLRSALATVVLLALAGGLLGAWIVLRRLAFFTHAVGPAAFPALVAAQAIGVSARVAGLAAALTYAGTLAAAGGGGAAGAPAPTREGGATAAAGGAATALLLVAALALGVVLASDVTGAGAGVERLLFGSLLGTGATDVALAGIAAAAALAATLTLGRSWLAAGFDPVAAAALDRRRRRVDALLLVLVAAAVAAALPAVGALLVTALFVVPAATARLLARTVRDLLALAVLLALGAGVGGVVIAYAADLPPGPAVAVVGGGLHLAVAAASAAARRRPRAPLAGASP